MGIAFRDKSYTRQTVWPQYVAKDFVVMDMQGEMKMALPMKFVIATEIGADGLKRVCGNWGGVGNFSKEEIRAMCGWGKNCEIAEVQTSEAIQVGFPLCCYNTDWTLKTPQECDKMGYNELGELKVDPKKEAVKQKIAKAEKDMEKSEDEWFQAAEELRLTEAIIRTEKELAREQAIDELIAGRADELLKASANYADYQEAQRKQKPMLKKVQKLEKLKNEAMQKHSSIVNQETF